MEKQFFKSFFKELNKEQLTSIKVVTGDGARWITGCVRFRIVSQRII